MLAQQNNIDISSLNQGITISGSMVYVKKKFFDFEECRMSRIFGFEYKSGVISIDLAKTSKLCLFNFLLYSFKSFMKDEKYETARKTLFADIKKAYDSLFAVFNEDANTVVPYYGRLFEHQKEGVFFGVNRKHNLLAFEQGLGKTITSATISSLLVDYNATVVIAPAACKWNWYEDLTNFGFDKESITIIDSKKSKHSSKDSKFIIINYDIFEKYIPYILSKFEDKGIHLVVDEAHKIKNKDAKRTKAVKTFVNHTKCKVTYLTGTPAANTILDVFSYLDIIGHETGANYKTFLKSYAEFEITRWGTKVKGTKNLTHLSVMLSNFMIRKTKAMCLDLPDKIYTKLVYELDDYQEEYLNALKEYQDNLKTKNKDGKLALHTLNTITAKSKVSKIKELVESITNDVVEYEVDGVKYSRGKKVVIFTSYTKPIHMIEEIYGNECLKIDGSIDSKKRLDIVNEFKQSDMIKVLVCNITAAGIGLNIVDKTITDVIFLNFPFTQAELDQAIDRLHRIGQTQCVNVYYTVCKDSIDEKLYSLLTTKYKDTSKLIDGKYNPIELSEENILDAIGQGTLFE